VAGTLQDGRRHAFRGRHPRANQETGILAKIDPVQFSREVRQEVAKVTWPSRRETLITTGLVLALSSLAAVFFLVVDQIIQFAMSWIFGF
jgi:preprotein translocase subunit SecE